MHEDKEVERPIVFIVFFFGAFCTMLQYFFASVACSLYVMHAHTLM